MAKPKASVGLNRHNGTKKKTTIGNGHHSRVSNRPGATKKAYRGQGGRR